MILLEDEEILLASQDTYTRDTVATGGDVARAQLKKVVGWIFGECENDEHEHGYSGVEFLRYECRDCVEALKKEAGL